MRVVATGLNQNSMIQRQSWLFFCRILSIDMAWKLFFKKSKWIMAAYHHWHRSYWIEDRVDRLSEILLTLYWVESWVNPACNSHSIQDRISHSTRIFIWSWSHWSSRLFSNQSRHESLSPSFWSMAAKVLTCEQTGRPENCFPQLVVVEKHQH